MPRQARIESSTKIYHIMTRGINKEKIFKNEKHKNKIIEIIKDIKEEVEVVIIAYCIMDNHLHLLVKVDLDKLEILMKKINIKYAIYYNKSADRNGHVFQDRFRSEAVEDDTYLIGVLRYIHNNPVKAKIVSDMLRYKWSSANEYVDKNADLVSEQFLLEILDLFKNKNDFIKFHYNSDDVVYIDIKEEEHANIENIVNGIIEDFANENQITEKNQFTQIQKEELAKRLIKINTLTYRDIAELCNLSIYRISEIKKQEET